MTEPRRIDPVYRTGYNGTGVTLAKGTLVNWNAAGIVDEVVASTGATDAYAGVCANDILTGEYGDIQVRGICPTLVGAAGITIGDRAMWAAGASVVACTAGNAILGIAHTTAASGGYTELELTGGAGAEMP